MWNLRTRSNPFTRAAVTMHLGWARVARDLGEECPNDARFGLTELQWMLVESAIAREDWTRAAQAVRDFRADNKRPQIQIEKFSPGEHYYVGRTKFDSEAEAVKHAHDKGYRVLPGIRVVSMNDLILAARSTRREPT